jgi:hypothetical protein
MITNRSPFRESQCPAVQPTVRDPAMEEKLYDTFVKMRDLLEEYAPRWYSDDLREKAEAVVRRLGK